MNMTSADMRTPPPNDRQRDFFVPVLYDIPIKDDVNLLDVSPCRPSVQSNAGVLHYNVKGAEITISGGIKYGLATIKDYDVIIHMISYLNEENIRYQKGLRPDPPPRAYRPHTYDMLKFLRRSKGGKQYKVVEDSYDRLNATTIKIVSDDGSRRHSKGFSLIDGWEIVAKSDTGKILTAEVGIPSWIYDGIVNTPNPTVLTMNPDYFLLKKPLDRMLYRLARRAAGYDEAIYSLENVHHRSGSSRSFDKFVSDLRKMIGAKFRIVDYIFTITKGITGEMLYMRYIGEDNRPQPKTFITDTEIQHELLPADLEEAIRNAAPGWDPYEIVRQWKAWSAGKGTPVKNPRRALIRFAEEKYARFGRP